MIPFDDRWFPRCLTVMQPFATAMVLGAKRVENRSWPLPTGRNGYPPGSWVVLHAGASVPRGTAPTDPMTWMPGRLRRHLEAAPYRVPLSLDLQRRAIVGAVRFDWQARVDAYRARHPEDVYAVGPWCWRIGATVALPVPVPLLDGRLGIWRSKSVGVIAEIAKIAELAREVDARVPLETPV